MRISLDTFLSRPMDPLSYYNYLPSDDIWIEGVAAGGDNALLLCDRLRGEDPTGAPTALMDALSVALINEFEALAGDAGWRPLADQMAQWYAQTLRPGGSKPVRMRAQLLNFFLRDIIDAKMPGGIASSRALGMTCPWDFLMLPDETIWLTSDQQNVIRERRDGTVTRSRCGLPTRLDPLGDGRIGIHSLYSPGAFILDGSDTIAVAHETPIIMLIRRGSELLFVDHQTRVFEERTRRQVAGPLLEQAHYARVVGDRVFLIDCCQVGLLYELGPDLGLIRHEIAPVLICNDICLAGDQFYLIDKEQGSVFAFDRSFRFIGQRLAFGRAPGRLWDPAALRFVDGQLQVLNWFASSLVTLEPF